MSQDRIWVCPIARRERDVDEVRSRLRRLGGVIVFEDVEDLSSWQEYLDGADVIVILVCRETINDPTIKDIVTEASRLGKRVVGIWLDDDVGTGIPGFMHREGDAVVEIDDEKIKRTVLEGESIWFEPSGEPGKKQKVPRHKGH